MVHAAAQPDRHLVEGPQTGRSLPRVGDLCSRAGHRADELAGERRYAAHTLKEVERGPFAAEYPFRIAVDPRKDQARFDRTSVLHKAVQRDAVVAVAEHDPCNVDAGDDPFPLAEKLRCAEIGLFQDRLSGDIAEADIFHQRQLHNPADTAVVQRVTGAHRSPA